MLNVRKPKESSNNINLWIRYCFFLPHWSLLCCLCGLRDCHISVYILKFIKFFENFWPHHHGMWNLILDQGLNLHLLQWSGSLNHWPPDFSEHIYLLVYLLQSFDFFGKMWPGYWVNANPNRASYYYYIFEN